MTIPTVELSCDACSSDAFLYRLHGTTDALCAACFVAAYPPESAARRRRAAGSRGFAQRLGRSMAGCSRVAAPRR